MKWLNIGDPLQFYLRLGGASSEQDDRATEEVEIESETKGEKEIVSDQEPLFYESFES